MDKRVSDARAAIALVRIKPDESQWPIIDTLVSEILSTSTMPKIDVFFGRSVCMAYSAIGVALTKPRAVVRIAGNTELHALVVLELVERLLREHHTWIIEGLFVLKKVAPTRLLLHPSNDATDERELTIAPERTSEEVNP